jgi:hypothetical protein
MKYRARQDTFRYKILLRISNSCLQSKKKVAAREMHRNLPQKAWKFHQDSHWKFPKPLLANSPLSFDPSLATFDHRKFSAEFHEPVQDYEAQAIMSDCPEEVMKRAIFNPYVASTPGRPRISSEVI